MRRAFVGLGSNLGDRRANIEAALRLLRDTEGIESIRVSSMYETDPVGVVDQPDFLNAACEVSTTLDAHQLLARLKAIEAEVGRSGSPRWGPREIDLDLLLFGGPVIADDSLEVPHPELTKRSFVMVPLLELDPMLELPSGEPLSAFCEKNPLGVRLVGPLTL